MPDNDADQKSLVGTMASMFSWNLPVAGTVRRGLDTLGNVSGDVKDGKFGKALTDAVAGGGENLIASMPFQAATGAAWRTAFGSVVSHVAGEQYRPEASPMVKDARVILHKLAPKR